MFDNALEITSIIQGGKIPPPNPTEKAKSEGHNYPPYLIQLNAKGLFSNRNLLSNIDMLLGIAYEGNSDDKEELACDLAESIINLINLSIQQDADTVFFLDKSARPAAHLFRKTWRLCFPQKDMPEVRFVNIGTENGEKYSSSKSLNELRNAHRKSVVGKKVIIADEYVDSGGTLVRAKKVFESVFPDARGFMFTGIFKYCPRWYHSKIGIGVIDKVGYVGANTDSFISATESGRQRRQRDVNRMRQQLDYLAKRISKHKFLLSKGSFTVFPYMPSYISEYSGLKEIVEEQINQLNLQELLN